MYAFVRQIVHRSRSQAGFGMIELIAAMMVMAIGVLAVFAMYHSSMTQLRRASTISTAAALADTEMENYRALEYESIGLASSDVGAADSTYTGQSGGAYLAISSPTNQVSSTVVVTKCPGTPCTNSVPTRTATGADGKSYRVDTYITWQAHLEPVRHDRPQREADHGRRPRRLDDAHLRARRLVLRRVDRALGSTRTVRTAPAGSGPTHDERASVYRPVRGRRPRARIWSLTIEHMTIRRMDHVGIVVDDLAAAAEFFVELTRAATASQLAKVTGCRLVRPGASADTRGCKLRTASTPTRGLRVRALNSSASWSATRTAPALLRPRPEVIIELRSGSATGGPCRYAAAAIAPGSRTVG